MKIREVNDEPPESKLAADSRSLPAVGSFPRRPACVWKLWGVSGVCLVRGSLLGRFRPFPQAIPERP